jgi:hypothetical protein
MELVMRQNMFINILIICIIPIALNAQNNKSTIQTINNSKPKYSNEQFIKLVELHQIDFDIVDKYYIYGLGSIGADKDTNLYILDFKQDIIYRFNKNGLFEKEIVKKGQGPFEINDSYLMSIDGDNIYVYERLKGLKEFNFKEKYSRFFGMPTGNYRKINVYNDLILTVNEHISINSMINKGKKTEEIEYQLTKYYKSEDERKIKDPKIIYNYKYFPQKDKIYNILTMYYIVAMNSKKQIFYPTDINEYKINVFADNGQLLQIIGREYKPIKYSKNIIDYFKKESSFFKKEKKEFPKLQPVIRNIIVDDKDYLWVLVGEISVDVQEKFPINTTVDIFNDKGEYIYTFQTPFIGMRSIIKNGRLYSSPTEEDRKVHVFKIHYLGNK